MKLSAYFVFLVAVVLTCASGPVAFAKEAQKSQRLTKAPENPQQELQALKDGNSRFIANQGRDHDYHYQIDKTKEGQKPYGVILSCLDSRVPPEIVFDQGIGDLFVARVAGNIENSDILGSFEFGTAVMGAKLIVVMGHTKCGAIKGACNNVKLGNLTGVLDKIQPSIKVVRSSRPKFDPNSYTDIDHVAEENVRQTIDRIRAGSEIVRKLESEKKIQIVGAMYDISTGKVDFMEESGSLAKE